jgi:hypothetical protein
MNSKMFSAAAVLFFVTTGCSMSTDPTSEGGDVAESSDNLSGEELSERDRENSNPQAHLFSNFNTYSDQCCNSSDPAGCFKAQWVDNRNGSYAAYMCKEKGIGSNPPATSRSGGNAPSANDAERSQNHPEAHVYSNYQGLIGTCCPDASRAECFKSHWADNRNGEYAASLCK